MRPGLAWNGKSENKTKVFQSIRNNFFIKSVPKWKQNLEKWRSRGGFEALGEPPGAKMPQGADWDALGAPFGGLWEHILAPRWAKLGPRWR